LKCTVSTNIAETSVTIDGIRIVVDSRKVKRDELCSNLQNAETQGILDQSSQHRTAKREGRCGTVFLRLSFVCSIDL